MNDMKFISPATIVLSGTTSSGKSTWIERFLRCNMFDKKPERIFYCYGVYQKKFELMPYIEFIHGLPDSFVRFHGKHHNLIIIDDLQDEVANSKLVEQLFTRESHHRNLSVVYINQNLFYQGKHSRTIALNTLYCAISQPESSITTAHSAHANWTKTFGRSLQRYHETRPVWLLGY